MSSLEKINLLIQTVQNMEGLRRDIITNANEYLIKIKSADVNALSSMMMKDAQQYLMRVQWQKDIVVDAVKYQKLKDALVVLGATQESYESEIKELENVANIQSVVAATKEDITNKANLVLQNITTHDSVW